MKLMVMILCDTHKKGRAMKVFQIIVLYDCKSRTIYCMIVEAGSKEKTVLLLMSSCPGL